jgi:hypothetical protein
MALFVAGVLNLFVSACPLTSILDHSPIYIIKELVLKQCSKFYASRGNVFKLRITGLPKTWGVREREREN